MDRCCTSEELEWEMWDIFESGMFIFPIYEHKSARKIIRYLLYRGVLDEEIADAIEDSTADLHMWLNRSGKYMVGEWVIAWVNEIRDEYKREKLRLGEHLDEHLLDDGHAHPRAVTPTSDSSDSSSDIHRHNFRDEIDHYSETTFKANQTLNLKMIDANVGDHDEVDSDFDSEETEVKKCGSTSPPPLPPRTIKLNKQDIVIALQAETLHSMNSVNLGPMEVEKLDFSFSKERMPSTSSGVIDDIMEEEDNVYEHPDHDSGAVSDLYSCIPHDRMLEVMSEHDNGSLPSPTSLTSQVSDVTLPICPNCTCTLVHYGYNFKTVRRQITTNTSQSCDNSTCIFFPNSAIRAMEFTFESLDKDGPGFIFIMTDSLQNCLSWTHDYRYKVASSRNPERCLMEFHARNIEIDLIWQVKVTRHIKALREVHENLERYNLHTNWFKCSLSVIMDAVALVVRKYKLEQMDCSNDDQSSL